ncbi:MAG: hypothetical protein GF344_16925 [Chitinivibrionales bacterium]|nr:hypothetical protein [Chitinivibrionales bacterium]MBD3358366.1 hypothetical protein [Chitinivibrionales bacterium]
MTTRRLILHALMLLLPLTVFHLNAEVVLNSTELGECWGVGACTAPNNGFQIFYGIGDDPYTAEQKDSIFDYLFLNSGANCGFTNIRHEMLCYHTDSTRGEREWMQTHEPENDEWNWGADSCQMWFLGEAMERHSNYFLHTCPWSPPVWMKSDGSETKGGKLIDGLEEELAEYFVVFLNKYKNDYDITFNALSIQNEPNFSPPWASCEYNASDFDRVVPVIHAMMDDSGLSDVLLGAPNHGKTSGSYDMLNSMSDSTKELLDWIPTNDYTVFEENTDLTVFGKPVMVTEIQYKNSRMGPQDQVAAKFVKRFNRGENGMDYWRYIRVADDDDENAREGLVGVNLDATIIKTKMSAYLGVLSRAMRNGNTLLATTNTIEGVNSCGSRTDDGRKRLVVASYDSTDYTDQSVTGFDANDSIMVLRSNWDGTEHIAQKPTIVTDETGSFTTHIPRRTITAFISLGTEGSVKTFPRKQKSVRENQFHGPMKTQGRFDVMGRSLQILDDGTTDRAKAVSVEVKRDAKKRVTVE